MLLFWNTNMLLKFSQTVVVYICIYLVLKIDALLQAVVTNVKKAVHKDWRFDPTMRILITTRGPSKRMCQNIGTTIYQTNREIGMNFKKVASKFNIISPNVV